MRRVLLVDNYDSFVGNLYQLLGGLGANPVILRNDAPEVGETRNGVFTHVVISPGPCTPREAGRSVELVRRFAGSTPVLGVCLGHQCIGEAFGARIRRAKRLVHGKTSRVSHDGRGVLAGLPSPLVAARYHSLALARSSLPDVLEVTAWTEDGEVMGVRHREFAEAPVEGVQFHPESFLSAGGLDLIRNFLDFGREVPA